MKIIYVCLKPLLDIYYINFINDFKSIRLYVTIFKDK